MTRKKTTISTDNHAGKASKPSAGKAPLIHRTNVKRLFLKVAASGARSWLFICRIDGKQQRMVIGHYPAMSLTDARTEAEHWGSVAASGQCPRHQREQKREAKKSRTVKTVLNLLEEFDIRHISKLSRPDTPRGRINKWIKPALGKLRLVDVKKSHFVRLANKIEDTGVKHEHIKINKLCRQLWAFGIERGFVDSNPVPILKSTHKPRERFLSGAEISKLWRDADAKNDSKCPYSASHKLAWKLIILTGQRINSLLSAKVDHFDLETGLWTIPAELMKSQDNAAGQAHIVHLSPMAVDLVRQAINNRAAGYVFTAVTNPFKPLSASYFTGRHTVWLQRMGIPHATIHDYRRALSTHSAELGIAPHISEKILAHKMGGVMAVYNKAQYLEARKLALHAYSDWVQGVTHGSNVVAFKAAVVN